MRHIFNIFSLVLLTTFLFGQSAETVFITDSEIEWLEKEIIGFEETLGKIQKAVDDNDPKAIAANRTAMIKSINRLSSNCNIMRNKIETEINPPAKNANRDLDTPLGYYYNMKKKQDALQELKLSDNNVAQISTNALDMKEIKDQIAESEYYFDPRFSESKDNLSLAYQLLDLAKSTNSIIQRSKVD
jgi:hypothetical protein